MIKDECADGRFLSGALHPAMQERCEFAAKVRAARAVLGWSQAELAQRAGITQRTVTRLEHGGVDVKHSTAIAIEVAIRAAGIVFEGLPRGGFRMIVSGDHRLGDNRLNSRRG
jgi:transcriptional regulator with XRE-family HTH domain